MREIQIFETFGHENSYETFFVIFKDRLCYLPWPRALRANDVVYVPGAFGERLYAVNVQRHVGNNLAWLEVMRRETLSTSKLSFRGLVLTGWSRYDHFAVLCELLPIALPSLILNLVVVTQGRVKIAFSV